MNLRARLLLALLATSVVTLAVAALALLSPLQHKLDSQSRASVEAAALATRPALVAALARSEGTVNADVVGECSRCLGPVTEHVEVDVTELYAYPDSVTDETTDEDDVSRIVDEKIDLEPAVRDAVLLELPNAPLCREDCPGVPSPDEQAWAFVPAGTAHERIDPRWAVLQERFAGGSTTEN